MNIAYFINQYPKVSHTFIRREILALESIGVKIQRYSLRSHREELIDPDDIKEFELTNYILETFVPKIMLIFFATLARQPRATLRALCLAARIGWRSDRGILRHMAYVIEASVLANWCERDGVTHIHAHFGTNSATVAMLAKELSGLSFSFTAHGADELDAAGTVGMAEKLRQASFIVGVSWYVRSQLLRKMESNTWKKIKVVHCGLDRSFLDCPAPKIPLEPRLVCVGRLCEEKAQLLLVEAATKLRARGIDFKLVFAGDGTLRPQIERAVADAGLQENIAITGWISSQQVRQELSAARALILPSLIEGLPVAIMEAMALGRPVISTFIAGIPELVVSGTTGWLVPAGDVDALTDAMARVLEMPVGGLEAMGRAGQLRVRERHNVLSEAEKLKKLFAGGLA